MSAPRITIDKSRFPLIVQTVCEGYGREDLEHMFREYDSLLEGKERYALVIHFPLSAALLRAGERRLVADWWIPRRARIAHMNVMYAMVLESALLRGALTALLWMVEPGNPHKVTGTIDEGIALCVQGLDEAKILIPPSLSRFRART
jgi:hypothetical protein